MGGGGMGVGTEWLAGERDWDRVGGKAVTEAVAHPEAGSRQLSE